MSAEPIVVHVPAPAGERWKTTCWTPVLESLALAAREIVPATGVPGSFSETVGASVSTLTVVVMVVVLPTLSVPVRV